MTAAELATVPTCPTTSEQFRPKTVQSETLKDERVEEAIEAWNHYRTT